MSLAFVRGIHQWPVNSLQKGLVTQKMFPFNDVVSEQKDGTKQSEPISVNLPSLVQKMACRLVGANTMHLSQCWIIFNLTLRNKIQWNIDYNSYIFIQQNVFKYVICEMSAILSPCIDLIPVFYQTNWLAKAT